MKYVDDILSLMNRRKIGEFLRALNAFHPRIQFTIGNEREGKLPYLDLLVIRQDERIVTDWYQKPTASGRLLNYFSGHKLQQKRNVAFNLFLRVLTLSDEQFHQQNIDKVFKILKVNNYPRKVIVSQLNRAKQRIETGVRDVSLFHCLMTHQQLFAGQ